jgi:ariadne-1
MEDEDFEMAEERSASPPMKQMRSGGSGETAQSIFSRSDIDGRMSRIAADLMEVTNELSHDDAWAVLVEFSWNSKRVEEEWFETNGGESSKRLKKCRSKWTEFDDTIMGEKKCAICLCNDSSSRTSLTACGHSFCSQCFSEYLRIKVKDGQASVETRCPAFQCAQRVPVSLMEHLLACHPGLVEKLREWHRFFFVSSSSAWLKWCPNPTGCLFALTAAAPACICGHVSCWACERESHVPVACSFAEKWSVKNSSEAENISWIIANTKPCPKCKKPIEKNQGCNHMTCLSKSGGCGFDFCWMCLAAWSSHGSSTGGFYSCNLYPTSNQSSDEVAAKERMRNDIERYMFYFSRYMNHHKSGILARKELEDSGELVEKLHAKLRLSVTELEFIPTALKQVCECRRVLKWTYVYGFYLSEINAKVESRDLFEYLQKNLEELTDRLHEFIEKDLAAFVKDDQDEDDEEEDANNGKEEIVVGDFARLRSQVGNQCTVTRNFFRKIIQDLN